VNFIVPSFPVAQLDTNLQTPAPDIDSREEANSAPQHCLAEYTELYYGVEELRVNDSAIVVQFTGPNGAEGTTTIASGFARAASLAAGPYSPSAPRPLLPVLYLDCGGGEMAAVGGRGSQFQIGSLAEAFRSGESLAGAIFPAKGVAGVCWAWLGEMDASSGSVAMADLMHCLRSHFSLVVLDCPAISRGIRALSLARHCDGTLLVVQAARTRMRSVEDACDRVNRLGGQVVGTVFNQFRPTRWYSRRAHS
jgi:hypothetical protein